MSHRRPFRFALFAILAAIAFVILLFPAQLWWYRFMTYRWESQIKHNQSPAELQSWAIHLLDSYGRSNVEEMTQIIVTNKPPAGIPIWSFWPRVDLVSGTWSGCNEDYAALGWGSGFMPGFGVYIGTSNFVCGSKDIWKPGIYFVRTP